MSDYAYVAERARKAFASVSRLEQALEKSPTDKSLLLNISAMRRLAEQAQAELLSLAARNRIEICNYRLIPEQGVGYALPFVSRSYLTYQNLFSQIYDAIRNGKLKERTVIQREAEYESMMEVGYTYSGSLGVVLLAQSEADFFEGNLDKPIEALFQVMDISDNDSVKDIAGALGPAVVKRVFDWSKVNAQARFSADVRWNRSDGRQLGQVVEHRHMERIVDIIGATSDETTTTIVRQGMLVGTDLPSRSFHFVVPDGDSYKGTFHSDLHLDEVTVAKGKMYDAEIVVVEKYHYATEKTDTRNMLRKLTPVAATT
ncbi:hypothetical protein [Mesorhizobium silamurunense]|uniref:hypothetical protein n=1 Tax=Mesorhizobium silamurunense TaxID=499528 RepID=UPI00178637E1|nr:hypothetical protein [Mesorhizobium silamurunense]